MLQVCEGYEKLVERKCMTCGTVTTNSSGFCTVQGWDSCKTIFKKEYGSMPTKKELQDMVVLQQNYRNVSENQN